MPYVNIQMVEGRSKENRKALIEEVIQSVSKYCQVPTTSVHVIISEVPKENIATSGRYRGD